MMPTARVTTERPRVRGDRLPWSIFWIALALRIGALTLGHSYRFPSVNDHFSFGWEMGRIARALATGYGYADPFRGHTGPTAWEPPLYPWLLGLDFRIFGVYSSLAAWLILAFGSLLNALMIPNIWEIARRCFDRRVALWSAWIWALYPAAMQYAVRWIWDITLTTWLFTCVLVLALRMRGIGNAQAEVHPPELSSWGLFGLLWALIALSNPSLGLFAPVCGIWILLGVPSPALGRQVLKASLSAVVCLACLAPWSIRNERALHAFVPIRSNFGAELYMGNGPGANGLVMGYDHPFENSLQRSLYAQMGEIAYARWRGRLAVREIRIDPGHFAIDSLKRFYFFWFEVPHPSTGKKLAEALREVNFGFTTLAGFLGLTLVLQRRVPAARLFAWAFVLLPFAYYFVYVTARFRHPLEPLITILTVYLFQSAEKSWQVRWFRKKPAAVPAS